MISPSSSEMPTSGELKSGDSLFFIKPPNNPTPPPPTLRKFRTLYEVLHEVDTIKICDHRFDARNNHCWWLNRCKMPQKLYYEQEKFKFWAKNWPNFKRQKSSKYNFIQEIKWPVQETGRLVSYPGDSWIIWEGWHVSILCRTTMWQFYSGKN